MKKNWVLDTLFGKFSGEKSMDISTSFDTLWKCENFEFDENFTYADLFWKYSYFEIGKYSSIC